MVFPHSTDIGSRLGPSRRILFNAFSLEQVCYLHHRCLLWDAKVVPGTPVPSILWPDVFSHQRIQLMVLLPNQWTQKVITTKTIQLPRETFEFVFDSAYIFWSWKIVLPPYIRERRRRNLGLVWKVVIGVQSWLRCPLLAFILFVVFDGQ